MQVTRSSYYDYLRKKVSTKQVTEVTQQVTKYFTEHRRRYGSRRLAQALQLSRFVVRRLMKEQGLQAIQPKRFTPRTTESRHPWRISENLVSKETTAAVIVGDITYVPLKSGKFCYLAMFQERTTRRIVGWEMATQMTAELVVKALAMAARRGYLQSKMIVHTDRGSQYASNLYRAFLQQHNLQQSMSGKGNCYDNAQAESFFARYKAELVNGRVFTNLEEAKSETFSYIEGYYNRIRLHSSLGYKSPAQFAKEGNHSVSVVSGST
jgi:putative transposase